MYAVSVSLGKGHTVLYSHSHPTQVVAGRLRKLALSLGYFDAEVVNEKDFRQAQKARRRGKTDKGRPDKGAS